MIRLKTLIVAITMLSSLNMAATPSFRGGHPRWVRTKSNWKFVAVGGDSVSWLSYDNSDWICYVKNDDSALISQIQMGIAIGESMTVQYHYWNIPQSAASVFSTGGTRDCRVVAVKIND